MELSVKRKIGILGGNFNPIHNGHLAIAQKAYEQFQLDEIWFMPAYVQPLKQGLDVTSSEHRLNMVNLAIQERNHFHVCTYELEKQGLSYTAETLTALCQLHPNCEFSFILGADSIFTFERWKMPEQICSSARLLAAKRHCENVDEIQLYKKAQEHRRNYNARIDFIEAPYYDISSTQIRELLSDDELAKEQNIIPSKVFEYIRENGLYK